MSCRRRRSTASAGESGGDRLTARNRFRGVVRSVEVDGLLARVEIDVTEPARVVAIVTREAVEELGLKPGDERGRRGQVDERDGGAVRRRLGLAVAASLAVLVAVSLIATTGVAAPGRQGSGPATVLAAASLAEVLPAIDPEARASFGGSNQLAQQARQGFPFDVFLSASPVYTEAARRGRAGAPARPVRDEQPRADRAPREPRANRDGRRPRAPPEAPARRGRAEGADRPLHA